MNHKKWFGLLFVLIGVVLVLAILPGKATKVADAQGGLNLDQHCRQHGRDHAVNIDGTAYGWWCVDSQGQQFPMSIQDACNEQYGSGYTATFSNMNDPNSWTCVAQSQPVNPTAVPPVNPPSNPPTDQVRHEGIDLARYCQDKGLGTIVLIGTHARDWRCQSGSTYSGLNLQEACLMQHGLGYVGLLSDDPYGWFCSNQPETVVDGPESPLPGQSQSSQSSVSDPGPAHGNQASDTRTSSGGCAIQSFTMTPQGPYVFGQQVTLEVRSTCGTVKFSVDGLDKAEIGSTNQVETWKTNETGVGTIHVCALGRGDGGWSNAAYICYDVYVGPQYRVDAYRPVSNNSGGSSSSGDTSCPSSPSGLSVGLLAVVNSGSINVRGSAGLSSGSLRSINRGEVVSVISGPQCRDGYRWWEIGTNGWSGWSAEVGSNGDYLLLPNGAALTPDTGSGNNNQNSSGSGSSGSSNSGSNNNSGSSNSNVPACSGAMASRMQVGMSGRVSFGHGTTNLYNHFGGTILLYMPQGYEFTVTGGPSCHDSTNWWQLRTNDGTTGWSAEGNNGSYWIEPWVSNNASNGSGGNNSTPPNPASQFDLVSPYDSWDFSTQAHMLQAMLDIDWQSAVEALNDMTDCGITTAGLGMALSVAWTFQSAAPDLATKAAAATAGFTAGLYEYVDPDTAGQCALAIWDRLSQ